MKVLIAARHPVGGIKTYLKYVHGCSPMHDIDVVLVTPELGDRRYFAAAFPNVELVHVETSRGTLGFCRGLNAAIQAHRPDLIHAHGFFSTLAAALPAKMLAMPLIATTHDVFMPAQFSGFRGKIKRALIGQMLRLPDLINPVGEDARKNLVDTFPHLDRPNLIPIRNGIRGAEFTDKVARNLKAELTLGDNDILLGFFGRFMSQKGFNILTDAVEEFNRHTSGVNAYIACFGWGGFIREEQERLQGSEVEGQIFYFDHTDDMGATLRGVDAVVAPSRWEACPLLPMEAMVSGVPLIASDCIGMREVLKDTPAQVFKSGSAKLLTAELEKFSASIGERKLAALKFQPIALSRFEVAHTAARLRDLYKQAGVRQKASNFS